MEQKLEQVNLREEVVQIQKEIIEVRRHLHQYPETAYQEFETAKFIVSKLKELQNIEIIENVGVTGVVGILRGKFEGPCILLRADMDALDLTENSGEEFESKIKGKHHACGHDGHCSMLLAAAKIVSKWTDKMHGIIKFCFQPAEEKGAGAKAMVNDTKYPLLQNPRVDQAYGAHLYNTLYYPKVCSKAGPMNANSDRAIITINGKGSSAYLPQYSTDAIYIGAQLVNQLYSITARNLDPMNPGTVSVGQFNGGTAPNIISETSQLSVSLRSTCEEDRQLIKDRIYEICKGMEISYNCKIDIDYAKGYNAIQNQDIEVKKVLKSAKKISPEVYEQVFGLAGEDFCFISSEVQSAFFLLGSAPQGSIKDNGRNVTIPHHSPLFTIDERCLILGTSIWVQLVEDQLIKV